MRLIKTADNVQFTTLDSKETEKLFSIMVKNVYNQANHGTLIEDGCLQSSAWDTLDLIGPMLPELIETYPQAKDCIEEMKVAMLARILMFTPEIQCKNCLTELIRYTKMLGNIKGLILWQ